MNPGYMRTPLSIRMPVESVDEYGQTTVSYTIDDTIFAAVNEASAEEKMNHRQQNQLVTHRIRTRWHPNIQHRTRLQTVANTGGMTVRTWEVVTAINWQERREYLDLVCREVVT